MRRPPRAPRPLDRMTSIKTKLGILIVVAVVVTLAVNEIGTRANYLPIPRALVAIALGLVAVQLLARGMTSPLRAMAAAARDMARGDHTRRVETTSRDEVGELARAFNTMAAELEQVDRQRRDLIANVSHELRTPLSALRAVLENLVDGVEPTDDRTLRAALAQAERLGRLVEQLLDLSRLESGTVPFAPQPVPARAALAAVAEQSAEPGRVDVVADPGAVLHADPDRLHQALGNLVDNALRHSPAHGRVTLTADTAAGAATVTVADDGPGVAPADRERVFQRFARTDSARAADAGGSGLGLAVVRWVVDLHGGDVRIADTRAGCRVVVTLPGGTT